MLKFISTHDQLADLFTKSLPSPRFNWLTSKLMWKFLIRLRRDESHGNTKGPAHSNHEEEEEEAPMATPIKTVSCIRLGKHKEKLKQNITVSH